MKSYYMASKAECDRAAHKAAREEMQKYTDTVYDRISQDIFRQALAVCFAAREAMGDTPEQLREYKMNVEDMCEYMLHGFLGREFTTHDAIEHLKKIGIDFDTTRYHYDGEKI